MKVWIDQDLCTGDGLCEEIVPSIFQMHDNGLAYVKEVEWDDIYGPEGGSDPVHRGQDGLATVPEPLESDVVEASEECPGECIFIEKD